MNRTIKLLLIFFMMSSCLKSQMKQNLSLDSDSMNASNTLYFEILGSSMFVSLNFEKRLSRTLKNFTISVGMLYYRNRKNFGSLIHVKNYLITPIQLTYTRGRLHQFETGIGFTSFTGAHWLESSDNIKTILLNSNDWYFMIKIAGYRFQKATRGLFFRVNLTSSFLLYKSTNNPVRLYKNAIPYPGISIGYSFK